jgi:hypothetical protein
MTKTIKTIWIISTILLILTLVPWKFLHKKDHTDKEKLKLICFETGDGWGYKIMYNKKQIIYQPFIPAIKERKTFGTKQLAEATGMMVLEKIKMHDKPTLSIEELQRVGISAQ